MKIVNLCSVHEIPWERQFINENTIWGGYKFVFNKNSNYDYLIVFDDIKKSIKVPEGFSNLIHIATEPPTICKYHIKYLKQFKFIVSIQKEIDHKGVIYSQPGLNWHLGCNCKKILNFNDLSVLHLENKKKIISIITSNKKMTKDHIKRINFSKNIKKYFGEKIDLYGRGFNDFEDKIITLQDYRFQIVIENSSYENYFSEKLTDCILAGTYPIYYGCKNLSEYFPVNSFVQIDIDDFEESLKIIKNAISDNYDIKYKSDLIEAKRRILYEYNIFPMIAEIIDDIESGKNKSFNDVELYDSKLIPLRSEEFKKIKFSNFKYFIYLLSKKSRVLNFFVGIYIYIFDKIRKVVGV